MLKFIIITLSICFLFPATNLKKENSKLKGRKLWLSYDQTLINTLESEFKKIESGKYNKKKANEILAIADEYFTLKNADDKKKVSNLIKKLNKAKK